MFAKITDTIDLFRVGSEIANKGAWKQGGQASALLAALLVGVVKVLGDFNVIDIKLDTETATSIAGGIASVVLFVLNNITSKSCGLLPAKQAAVVTAEPATIEQPMEQSSVPDDAIVTVVQADKSIHVPSGLPLVSQVYIEEARAAAIKDRANLYSGA